VRCGHFICSKIVTRNTLTLNRYPISIPISNLENTSKFVVGDNGKGAPPPKRQQREGKKTRKRRKNAAQYRNKEAGQKAAGHEAASQEAAAKEDGAF